MTKMIIAQALVRVKRHRGSATGQAKEKGTRVTGSLYWLCGCSYLQLEGNYDTGDQELHVVEYISELALAAHIRRFLAGVG